MILKKKIKKFAEKDYKGLSKSGAKELREVRNKLADILGRRRKDSKEILKNSSKEGAALEAKYLDVAREVIQNSARKAKSDILGREVKKNLEVANKNALGLSAGLSSAIKKISRKKMSKGFSETKENASKGLAYGSTAAGLGALGATAASLGYGAKSVKRGLENSAAYEGKTLGELLKSKKFKNATTRVKRAINNREAKASNIAGKAGKIAGGLAAASIAMGAGSKLLKGKSDKNK